MLEGYLVAYLNLDEVIRIIRQEDEPKAELIRRFMLTDVQAEAILNMRLRSLRKLEEVEIRGEHEKLTTEKRGLVALLASDEKQWERISPADHRDQGAIRQGDRGRPPPHQLRRRAGNRRQRRGIRWWRKSR